MHFDTGYQRECIPLVLELLRAVRGIDPVELPAAEECCGFGGTFALKNADTSMAMLSDKVRHVLDTRAEVCVTVVGELDDWEELREAGRALRERVLRHLDGYLVPEVLVHLRNRVVEAKRETRRLPRAEELSMEALAWVFTDRRRYDQAQRLARVGQWLARSGRVRRLPAPFAGWTEMRDAPAVAAESFRDWWRARQRPEGGGKA